MDKIKDSGSLAVGSIPARVTILRLIFFLGSQSFCFYLSLSKQLAKHDYEKLLHSPYWKLCND